MTRDVCTKSGWNREQLCRECRQKLRDRRRGEEQTREARWQKRLDEANQERNEADARAAELETALKSEMRYTANLVAQRNAAQARVAELEAENECLRAPKSQANSSETNSNYDEDAASRAYDQLFDQCMRDRPVKEFLLKTEVPDPDGEGE